MLRCLFVMTLGASLVFGCEAPRSAPVCETGNICTSAQEPRCVLETRLYGRTSGPDGRCSAREDDACRAASVTCAVWGQCSAPTASDPTRRCAWTASDRDLQAARDPACAALGTCVAARDADCEASRGCSLEGRCRAREGICVGHPEDCKQSELCAALGWCTPTAGGLCRAGGPGDCEAAASCLARGECGFADGRCVACAESDGCRSDGRCERVDTTCRATRSADCQKAEVCKRKGLCKASQGACIR